MPKFSIVVPIYKVEQYLERCIESLINQTLQDIEIILVDDGSPDGCPAICERYASRDERIKVIHKENGGVSAARNDGLAIARGEYVIFCDSDDWMELDGCEILYNKGIETGADVVVGDINRIKGHEIFYNQYFANEFHYTDRADMDQLVMADIYQNYCPDPPKTPTIGYGGPWNKAVKRQFLIDHNINFDVSLMGLYDDILYTAYVYANMDSIVYIQKPVYNYVVVETSITKTYKANSLDISNRIFKAFSAFIKEYGSDGRWDKAFDALVVRRFEECLRLYFFSDQNGKGYKQIITELKETMAQEPYASAAKNVEIDRLLSHQARVAKIMKTGSATGLWGLYKLKKLRSSMWGGAELSPKFSVVVPVYNVEPYLERCIESLINQTLEDIEIILVDDGSPDNCPAICDRYAAADKRIKVIHKKNEGVSAARNDGLAMANGEWVICCDSDDWMEEDALENLYKAGIEKNADVVIADINRIKGNEIQYNQYFAHEFTYTQRSELDRLVMMTLQQTYCPDPPEKMAVAYGGPWNKAVKLGFLADKNIQFDIELLGLYDDTLYTAYLYANAECVTYIQKAVYNYVLVNTSLTKVYKANALDINNRVYGEFRAFIKEYAPDGKWDRAYDALVIKRFEECLRMYFFNDQNDKGYKQIITELKETLAKEPYVSAIKNVEIDRLLPYQARAAKLMRAGSTNGLWGLYKLRKLYSKVGVGKAKT